MAHIKINDQTYPFRLTLKSLERLLAANGHTFSTIGQYLQQRAIEGIYEITALGLNQAQAYGGKEIETVYSTDTLDEMIGMDMEAFGAVAEQISTYLDVSSTDTETDPK